MGAGGYRSAGAAGQLIRTLSPESVDDTCTSSARPVITARPNAAGKAASRVSAGTGWNGAPCPPLPADTVAVFITGANPPGSAPESGGAASVTTTSNRSPRSVSSIRIGSAGQCRRCASTAREQASPTASRTSSSRVSSTPLRRATAVATSRAGRTCAGSGVNVTSTVGILGFAGSGSPEVLLLGLLGRDGVVHALVDAEHLRQAGDPEDLEYPLLGADQVQGTVVGADPLEAADQHPETGGVEELDLLHVDHELVVVLVDQVDQELTKPRRRVDVDLALDVDNLDVVLVVVTKLQIHKSSSAITALSSTYRPAQSRA